VDWPEGRSRGQVRLNSWTMPPVTAQTLARATAEFLKVSNALIQALVLQVREPTEERQRLISELELKRDAAHQRLDAIEAEYTRARNDG